MPEAAPPLDVHRLITLGRVSAVAPSPCGTWAAVQVMRLDSEGAKYVSDLWRVPLAQGAPGGEPAPLTRGDSDDRSPRFRRDGALGFLSNRSPREGKAEEGDDERSQVWILPAAPPHPEGTRHPAPGGEPRPVTDEPL